MKYLIMFCLVLLAGCSTLSGLKKPTTDPVQAAQAQIIKTTQKDLTNGLAIAKAYGDQNGIRCITALQNSIPTTISNLPPVSGPISAYELARVKVIAFQNGIPPAVHTACAPVVLDAQGVLLKLGVIAAGAPGVGAAGLGILGAGKALAGATP